MSVCSCGYTLTLAWKALFVYKSLICIRLDWEVIDILSAGVYFFTSDISRIIRTIVKVNSKALETDAGETMKKAVSNYQDESW